MSFSLLRVMSVSLPWFGNGLDDTAADMGRLRQFDFVLLMLERRCLKFDDWYPMMMDLHKIVVAGSRQS